MTSMRSPDGDNPAEDWNRRGFLCAAGSLLALPVLIGAARPVQFAAGFIDAYNDGDRQALTSWASNNVSQGGLSRRSAADWADWLLGQSERTGALSLLALEQRGSELRLTCALGKIAATRRIDLRFDRDDPARIFDLRPVLDPSPFIAPFSRPPGTLSLHDRIRERLDFAVSRDEFSGVVRIDHSDAGSVFTASYGTADMSEGRPIGAGTRFNLGSADKSFTAILIGQMIEAGRLQLEDRVADLLPEFAIAGASGITVRHLLTHSAGLGQPPGGIHAYSHDRYDRVSELLPAIAAMPVAFAPGARTSYSNEGYVVLGAIIEQIAQAPFWNVLAERVYAPAAMHSSGHFTRDEARALCATGYFHERTDLFRCEPPKPNANMLPWRGNSCGGGFSTSADIAAWFKALSGGQLVKPETLDMLTRHAGEIYPGVSYGMGFVRETVGGTIFTGHSGGGANIGIGSSLRMSLDGTWSVAILGNYDLPYADAILHDILPMLAESGAI
ncbi:MAG: serine hydrolase domain-containing protein [Hyphomonas sp.]